MQKTVILDFLQQNKQKLAQDFGVTKIGLFGSYARDEAREDSDIDIAVEIESDNKFRSFFALKHFLEDGLGRRVDLGIESAIKPVAYQFIKEEIIYA
jgi:hypothetical protein